MTPTSRSLFRRLRWQAGLTQAQLAARFGVNQRSISTFERGGNSLAYWRVAEMAEWLGKKRRK